MWRVEDLPAQFCRLRPYWALGESQIATLVMACVTLGAWDGICRKIGSAAVVVGAWKLMVYHIGSRVCDPGHVERLGILNRFQPV